ncbi:MAG: T9SS type A sorting domain-containing protein [Rhodothermales bacterium]
MKFATLLTLFMLFGVVFINPMGASAQELRPSLQRLLQSSSAEAPGTEARVRWESRSSAPSYVARVRICEGDSGVDSKTRADAFIRRNADVFGTNFHSDFEVERTVTLGDYRIVKFQQMYKGYKILEATYRVNLDKEGCILGFGGTYATIERDMTVPSTDVASVVSAINEVIPITFASTETLAVELFVSIADPADPVWIYRLKSHEGDIFYSVASRKVLEHDGSSGSTFDNGPASPFLDGDIATEMHMSDREQATIRPFRIELDDIPSNRASKAGHAYSTNPSDGTYVIKQLGALDGTGQYLESGYYGLKIYNAAFNPLNHSTGAGTTTAELGGGNEYKFELNEITGTTCNGVSFHVNVDCSHLDDSNAYYHMANYMGWHDLLYYLGTTPHVEVESLREQDNVGKVKEYTSVADQWYIRLGVKSSNLSPVYESGGKDRSVIFHEYNHVVSREALGYEPTFGTNEAGAIDEGLADLLSALYIQSPHIMEGAVWCPPKHLAEDEILCDGPDETYLRTLDTDYSTWAYDSTKSISNQDLEFNTCSYQQFKNGVYSCASIIYTDNTEHALGTVLAGAVWDYYLDASPYVMDLFYLTHLTLSNLDNDADLKDFADVIRDQADLISGIDGPLLSGHLRNRNIYEHGTPRTYTVPSKQGLIQQPIAEIDSTIALGATDVDGLVRVYPNPVGSILTISLSPDLSSSLLLNIWDSLGRRVLSISSESNSVGSTQTLDVSNLSSGTYVVDVQTSVGNYRTTFVKI